MLRVKDLMTEQAVTCNPHDTLVETAQMMKEHDIGSVPVCEQGRPVGIVTDRDITLHVGDHQLLTDTLQEIMNPNILTIDPDASVREAEQIMADYQIRRLPVEQEGELRGMISLGDIAVKHQSDLRTGSTLRGISMDQREGNILQTQIHLAENSVHAKYRIEQLIEQGYLSDHIYVLSHNPDFTEALVENTEGNRIGMMEEGIFTGIANLFRDRGDELRAKIQSVGISKERAEDLEERLDRGEIVIIAVDENTIFDEFNPDPNIFYYPYNRII